jgi:hypothetical protein
MKDLTFLESLQRSLALVVDKVRESGEFAEIVIRRIIDTVMDVAINMLNLNNDLVPISTV